MVRLQTMLVVGLAMLFALLCRTPSFSGVLKLNADSAASGVLTNDSLPIGFALRFSVSSLPESTIVDRANLILSADFDSSLSGPVAIEATPLEDSWDDPQKVWTQAPATTDSLTVNAFAESGSGRTFEVDLTELVRLWSSGTLPNRGVLVRITANSNYRFELSNRAVAPAKLIIFYSGWRTRQ